MISKNDWEKGQVGLVTSIEKVERGFDRVYVTWTNEGYTEIYAPFYLQVINEKKTNVSLDVFDEDLMWRMWGDK